MMVRGMTKKHKWYVLFYYQDIRKKPKYLVTFTVGLAQEENINKAVKKVMPVTMEVVVVYFF